MTYNKIEIGIPTVEQIQECANKCGYKFNAYDCFAYFKAKDWKTEKGRDYWSLEFACMVYNGVAIYKQQKKVDSSKFKTLSYEGSPYKEQLLDKRWRLFREFAIVARGGVCENCGSKKNLVIHHTEYKEGYNAWDYSVKDVVCLCNNCHKKIHNIK